MYVCLWFSGSRNYKGGHVLARVANFVPFAPAFKPLSFTYAQKAFWHSAVVLHALFGVSKLLDFFFGPIQTVPMSHAQNQEQRYREDTSCH